MKTSSPIVVLPVARRPARVPAQPAAGPRRFGPLRSARARAAGGRELAIDYDRDERPPDEPGLAPGVRVVHASLGEGIVRSCDGAGPDAKVTVAFYDRGEKRVLARFLRPA